MTNTMQIVPNGEEADADYVVCVGFTSPLIFPDNLLGHCCKCNTVVQFRPHSPKLPPRICFACIMPETEREAAQGTLNVMVTPKTAQEVIDYFRRKRSQ